MKQINVKSRILTMTLIIIVLSFVIVFFVILPTIKNIRGLQKDINTTQQLLEDRYKKTQRVHRSIQDLDNIIKQTEKFENISITNDPELDIITKLEDIAGEYNITQTLKATLHEKGSSSMNIPNLPPLLKNKDYYIFSFSSEGKYENLMNYLRSIEKLPYYFSVNSVSLSKKDEGSDPVLKFDALLFVIE